MIGGRLLQTDKRFSSLKMSQKEKISDWLYEEYAKLYDKNKLPPDKRYNDYGLTWEDNRYYAIGFSVKHDKIVTFRADRMSCVEITDCPCIPKPLNFDIGEFVNQTFRMYDATLVSVTLKCKNKVMKSVIDRFGLDVQTEPYADGKHFKANVEIGVSQTFFGWVFQFGGDIQIVKPASVKKQFLELANAVCELI